MPPRARSELNTIIEPSGEKEGSRLFRLSWVILTGVPPDICRTQMSKPPLPAKSDAYASSLRIRENGRIGCKARIRSQPRQHGPRRRCRVASQEPAACDAQQHEENSKRNG